MKFNKWTLGLQAVGMISFASALSADTQIPTAFRVAAGDAADGGSPSENSWPSSPSERGPGRVMSSPGGDL